MLEQIAIAALSAAAGMTITHLLLRQRRLIALLHEADDVIVSAMDSLENEFGGSRAWGLDPTVVKIREEVGEPDDRT